MYYSQGSILSTKNYQITGNFYWFSNCLPIKIFWGKFPKICQATSTKIFEWKFPRFSEKKSDFSLWDKAICCASKLYIFCSTTSANNPLLFTWRLLWMFPKIKWQKSHFSVLRKPSQPDPCLRMGIWSSCWESSGRSSPTHRGRSQRNHLYIRSNRVEQYLGQGSRKVQSGSYLSSGDMNVTEKGSNRKC